MVWEAAMQRCLRLKGIVNRAFEERETDKDRWKCMERDGSAMDLGNEIGFGLIKKNCKKPRLKNELGMAR